MVCKLLQIVWYVSMLNFSTILLVDGEPNHEKVVFSKSIIQDGETVGTLEILDEEEPADSVYLFGKNHGLSYDMRLNLLNNICKIIPCQRDFAHVWSTPVSKDGVFIDTFILREDVEPIDAAHEFVKTHDLPLGYRNAILRDACEVMDCHRVNPIIWKTSVQIDNNFVELILIENEDPADSIFQQLQPLGVSFHDRKKIMDLARNDGIIFPKRYASIFSKKINLSNESVSNYTIHIYDDGSEPVDTIYQFTNKHSLDSYFKEISNIVIPQVCSLVLCQRNIPSIWSKEIFDEKGVKLVGTLVILMGQEPIDSVREFSEMHHLSDKYRKKIFEMVCNYIPCNRNKSAVYRKEVNDQNGRFLGSVEILEDEEVIDGIWRFLKSLGSLAATIDDISLKNHIFQNTCGKYERIKCTRTVANIYEDTIYNQDGSEIGRLEVTEYEEPADKVYSFCKDHGIMNKYRLMVEDICRKKLVQCFRETPVVFSMQLNDPDGHFIGNLEVKKDEEVIDALYAFFALNHLFIKGWDMRSVWSQICAQADPKEVSCNREKAVKFARTNVSIGDIDVGPVIVWDGIEIIDMLYELRVFYNFTVEDQMKAFSEICNLGTIFCGRSKAIMHKISDITKRDYEKFGNETCNRKYAGWQYLSSASSSFVGSKAIKLVQDKVMGYIILHPLISPFITWVALFISRLMLNRLHSRRKKDKKKHIIHIGHTIVTYIFVIFACSLFHVILIEPKDDIDQAMHLFEGKLPDLIVYEGDEPVDAVLRWGKIAAKDHHPIIREPIYWDMLEKICWETNVPCTRKRAWESIDMGHITINQQSHFITFVDPIVDRTSVKCQPILDGKANKCLEQAARKLCSRLYPLPEGCIHDLTLHMASQLDAYKEKRFDSKDTYVKLGISMDAPDEELFYKLGEVLRQRGMNLAPFSRIDNGTTTFPKWDSHFSEAFAAIDAFYKVRDSESREWNDKPCTPYFGGALCAKTDKDGNMKIEV